MTDLVLAIRGLTCWFGRREVVQGFDLGLGAGEVVGLVGPNGAGKSTVLNAISGFHQTWSGEIELLGEYVAKQPSWRRARKGLGRSFQLDRAFWQLDLLDASFAALVPGERAGIGSALRDRVTGVADRWWRNADGVVRRLGVGGRRTRVAALSGGQLRALSLELLSEQRQRVLLLDEPFAGLSPDRKARLRSELLQIEVSGEGAVLLVDHDLDQIRQCCRRVVVMSAGRKIAEGPPDEVLSDPLVLSSYLGRSE